MHERIAQRLADIKAQHATVLEDLHQVEQRREYLLQAALRLGGALAVLEELAKDRACEADAPAGPRA